CARALRKGGAAAGLRRRPPCRVPLLEGNPGRRCWPSDHERSAHGRAPRETAGRFRVPPRMNRLQPLYRRNRAMSKPIAAALAASVASAQALRIGLAEDPDVLDPTLARTFVGRIVFAGLCDKLVDIDKDLKIVPQLATSWEWSKDQKALTLKIRQGVTFHDG